MSDLEKQLSNQHEKYIADRLEGSLVKGSGMTFIHKGDVTHNGKYEFLIECKRKGKSGDIARSVILNRLAKITDEAYSHGRRPMLALRFFNPDHVLADPDGWVDLIVMRLDDYAD